MAVVGSGQIDLNQIHVEAGGGSGTQASQNDADIRDLIGKGSGVQSALTEWYGASAAVTIAVTSDFLTYQDGFTETGARSYTFSKPVTPTSNVGAVSSQAGWVPNSNGITWLVSQFATTFSPGNGPETAKIAMFFRDSTIDPSIQRTSQAPHYTYAWPMGNMTIASDANFTQNVMTIAPADWFASNSSNNNYNSWCSGLGWSFTPATTAAREELLSLTAENFHVKIDKP